MRTLPRGWTAESQHGSRRRASPARRNEGHAAFPVHEQVLGSAGVIAENLTNLSAIGDGEPLVCMFPIRLGSDADGAPCRAITLELSPG